MGCGVGLQECANGNTLTRHCFLCRDLATKTVTATKDALNAADDAAEFRAAALQVEQDSQASLRRCNQASQMAQSAVNIAPSPTMTPCNLHARI